MVHSLTVITALDRCLFRARDLPRRDKVIRKQTHQECSSKRPLLIHYHIFKNAGSSFEWTLKQELGKAFASLDSPTPRGFVSADDIARFVARNPTIQALSSHQAAPPPPVIPDREVFTSILIRDPIARIRSVYSFERSQSASTPGAIKAKELNFREYVDWRLETAPAMFCDYQVHFCLRTDPPSRLALGPEQLKAAIARLDSISIVGTVARYDEWLGLAQQTLSAAFPNLALRPTRQNVTSGADSAESDVLARLTNDLDDSTVRYLLEHNELDMRLYQVADALLTRRSAERGLAPKIMQGYLGALQAQPLSHT